MKYRLLVRTVPERDSRNTYHTLAYYFKKITHIAILLEYSLQREYTHVVTVHLAARVHTRCNCTPCSESTHML
jgi:hypothetical protein